ncbi:MAG: sporulation integral membrane protein YtvI [Syntrophomonadaceae bacterium]|nr:sporulation integral membrane protein YtvI [Syntrophomonadaceae bacterium]
MNEKAKERPFEPIIKNSQLRIKNCLVEEGDWLDPELQKHLKILVKTGIVVLVLLAFYLLFKYVFPMLGRVLANLPALFMPFIFAVLMAVLIEPVVNMFEKKTRLNRAWSVVLSLLLVVGGFISCLALLISRIISDMSKISPLVLAYSDQVSRKLLLAISDFKLFYLQLNLSPQVKDTIQSQAEKGIKLISSLMEDTINALVHAMALLPGIIVFLMIATVATFFFIKDRAMLRTLVMQFIPVGARAKTREIFAELLRALTGFIKAYSILITVTAIITMVFLKILGLDYIVTIGIIVGVMDILPILGPGAFFIPWIGWQFLMGNLSMGMSLLAVYLLISIVRQFLEPKIVGENIGLHPLATLISLYVGLQLGGASGMILGPVLLVIIIACYRAGLLDGFNWRKDE